MPTARATSATRSAVKAGQRDGLTPDEIERRLAGANLVRRVITADEIAYLVAFLASPKSMAINGDSIGALDSFLRARFPGPRFGRRHSLVQPVSDDGGDVQVVLL